MLGIVDSEQLYITPKIFLIRQSTSFAIETLKHLKQIETIACFSISFMKQTSFQFLMFLSSTANDTCSKSIQGVFLVDCRHDLVCILGKDMIRKQRLMALLVE